MSRVVRSAAALVIGNELLSGKTQDANLVRLASTLRALGIRLETARFVPDDREVIAREVRELHDRYDVVFTSGGVGPTHDDVTLAAVAEAFDLELVPHLELEQMLARGYGASAEAGYRKMTLLPRGAELIRSEDVHWPIVTLHGVWLLPGIPALFAMKLAAVREALRGPRAFVSRAVYVGLDEVELTGWLDRTVARFPEVEIGSYPTWMDSSHRTKVTFDAVDEALVDAAVRDFCSRLPAGEPRRQD